MIIQDLTTLFSASSAWPKRPSIQAVLPPFHCGFPPTERHPAKDRFAYCFWIEFAPHSSQPNKSSIQSAVMTVPTRKHNGGFVSTVCFNRNGRCALCRLAVLHSITPSFPHHTWDSSPFLYAERKSYTSHFANLQKVHPLCLCPHTNKQHTNSIHKLRQKKDLQNRKGMTRGGLGCAADPRSHQ